VILATGGTIAGTGATSTTTVGYTAATVGVQALIKAVPELQKVAHVSGEQVFQIASENMGNEQWLVLAKRVNALLAQPNVDGIVITHGTDTIEETAYFLNLVVKSRKPVVVVGAMRPSTAISADGPINLYNAVLTAGSADAVGKGVLVVMNDQINAAREVTKTNTVTTDTFKSPELGMLGYVVGNQAHFYRASTRKHTVDTEFDVSKLDALPAGGNRLHLCQRRPDRGQCLRRRRRQGPGPRGRGRRQPADQGAPGPVGRARKRRDHRAFEPRRPGHRGAQRRGQRRPAGLRGVGYAESAEGAHPADAGADQDEQHQGDSADVLYLLIPRAGVAQIAA
jgi:hypothetical protein